MSPDHGMSDPYYGIQDNEPTEQDAYPSWITKHSDKLFYLFIAVLVTIFLLRLASRL